MKRLLGLVMGMVGCGGGAPDWVSEDGKWVERDGLTYEGDIETPFTGVAVEKHENGQKKAEATYKDGKKVSETKWDEEGNVEE